MISRLMLSLKKASRLGGSGWTSNALSRTHPRTISRIEFGGPPTDPEDSGDTTSDEVAPSDLRNRRVRGGSDERTV